MQLRASLVDLVEFADAVAMAFQTAAEQKSFDFDIRTPDAQVEI